MNKLSALIFDMDGVIVHSNPLHRKAWALYNRRHNIETTEAMLDQMYGKRNDELVRRFFGASLTEEEVAAHGAAKEVLFREMIGSALDTFLVPGIREFLTRHQDLPTGLATNAEPANAQFVLTEAALGNLFRVVVDGHQVTHPKPDPEIYWKTASLLGVPPSECVVFEDSYSGVEAAQRAGMAVVGIKTTHSELPGTALAVDHFLDPALEPWLSSRQGIS